jgi:uncharacterized protein YecT (DUF1311 family)
MRLAVALVSIVLTVGSAVVARADDAANPWLDAGKVRATIGGCIAKNKQDDSSTKASHDCTDRYVTMCSAAGHDTTVAMDNCGSSVLDYWNAVVAMRTKTLLARHERDLLAYVRASDAAWRAYRTSRCRMYGYFDGTMWGPVGVGCMIDLTVDRATDLVDLDDNFSQRTDR